MQYKKSLVDLTYKVKINIPKAARNALVAIFPYKDLASDELKKCLHGQTQNVEFNNYTVDSLIRSLKGNRKVV